MRISQLFTKTRKEAPADEVSKNAQLLIRAGYIHKEMAGVYAFLPLGLRVVNKISHIIREEMNAIGGQELLLTALQQKEVWEKAGRWDDEVVDVWFKTQLKSGQELGLGFTHDEQLINVIQNHINSYRDLPFYPYQIQTKFRNELRAKSGLMRGREFLMKDLYSFNRTLEEQEAFYKKAIGAYMNVYKRCGLGDITYLTFSGGGTFSNFSHEFQIVTDAGEDIIYIHKEKGLAVNEEVYTDEVLEELGLEKGDLVKAKATEAGNIFKQGTRFTDAFGLFIEDEQGKKQSIYMGGYGIGVSRLMGAIAEILSDENGIVWPEAVAPFQVHLIVLGDEVDAANKVYDALQAKNIEVLYDDRVDVQAGEKFADADLMGMPYRVVVSKKSLEQGGYDFKARTSDQARIVDLATLANELGVL